MGPNGLIVPNGSIKFQLNVDATVIAPPGGFVAADIPVVFQFDKTGALIQPAKIWSNEELQPQLSSTLLGTYYLTTFYDQNGAVLNATPLWWQFPEVINSTVDISQMTPVSTVGGNVLYYPTSFGGSGTVTSVTFTGDGTVLSAIPSAPVTTSGTTTATLLTQNALTFLAGPTTPGPAAAPTFRTITTADVPPLLWNSLIAATADLTLANTTFNTTFTQTASTVTWAWKNITPATSLANQFSPFLILSGTYWNGSASATNLWTLQDVLGTGSNPTSTFTFSHGGTSGFAAISVPSLLITGSPSLPALNADPSITTDVLVRPNICQANFTGSINYANLRAGLNAIIHADTTGTVALAAAVIAETFVDTGAGVVANMKGIEIAIPVLQGGTAITLMEGVCVENMHQTGVTTSYGVHVLTQSSGGVAIQTEGTAPSIFGGAVTEATLTVVSATPTGSVGQISFGTSTATSASAGSNGDVPAQVVGYLVIDIAGTKQKIPYYAI